MTQHFEHIMEGSWAGYIPGGSKELQPLIATRIAELQSHIVYGCER
jgi:hypothetical protein